MMQHKDNVREAGDLVAEGQAVINSVHNLKKMIELARAHVETGGAMAAEVYYRMILRDTTPPKSGLERLAGGEAAMWFARKAIYEGKFGTAVDWYLKAIQTDPLAVDYRVEYCVKALIPMGMHKNARIEAERATKIDPQSKEAWRILGGLEQALNNAPASIDAYEKQLALDPNDPIARLDRATVALDTADYGTVRKMCEPVLSTDMAADACHTLAMVHYREGKHEEAIALYDEAIAGGCYDPDLATWNKALALHSIGRYKEGWAAHEHRGKQKTDGAMALIMNRFTQPMWNNEAPPARLHVHQEMGHGDVIAMARYLPLLVDQGYEVNFEVNESMVELMARSLPGVRVVPKALDYPGALGVPPFDYHVPSLSLPYLFGTDIDTVPWTAYLKASPALVPAFQDAITNDARGNKQRVVGLCWSSGIRTEGLWLNQYGKKKSTSFEELRSLLRIPNTQFVSLQVGPESAEAYGEILAPLSQQPTWDETAALIECLDLVITVDTSVAHLAGAMGKPVWVMMQQDGSSWHFMCERPGAFWNTRSPWYPSSKIYRQIQPGYWGYVVTRIKQDLGELK